MPPIDEQGLREEEGQLIESLRSLREREEEWSAEDREAFDTQAERYEEVLGLLDGIHNDRERVQRFDEFVAQREEANRQIRDLGYRAPAAALATVTEDDRMTSIQAWCRHQLGQDLSEEQSAAVARTGMNLHCRQLTFNLHRGSYLDVRALWRARSEMRQQATSPDSAGGYTVPETMVRELEIALLDYSGVRQDATVLRTAGGNPMPWPTIDDTSNEGAIVAENAQIAEQALVFSQVLFGAWKFSSQLVLMSQELIEDNAVNLVQQLGRLLGERIGRRQNRSYTVGDGVAEAQGITLAPSDVTAAANNAITGDELIDLVHSVDPAYRNQSARFQLHDTTLAAVRKLKDTTGNYIWQPGLANGLPPTILGYGYTVNNHMPVIASSAVVVVFGALGKYKIRDVAQFRLRRLVERYADFDQEGFVAFHRSDGKILDAGTGPIKALTMAV